VSVGLGGATVLLSDICKPFSAMIPDSLVRKRGVRCITPGELSQESLVICPAKAAGNFTKKPDRVEAGKSYLHELELAPPTY
jgi:hypothetical protein